MTIPFSSIEVGLRRAGATAIILIASIALAGPPREPARESENRLPLKDIKRINELSDRHDPAGVESFVASRPLMYHVFAARAYSRAGFESKDAAERELYCQKAINIYLQVTALRTDSKWLSGETRRLDAARWQMELADLYLRYQALPDLDRFEITSGLDFDRERLEKSLREAVEQYAGAKSLLDELQVTMRTDEERIMLLGLTEEIETLVRQRDVSAAWAGVFLAGILSPKQPERTRLMRDALAAFDNVAATSRDPAMKYNALIGSGVALREAGRQDEAIAAFEKVIASTAPAQSVTRARYEKARCLMAGGRYDAARRELEAAAKAGHRGKDQPGDFYARIAPIIGAYTFILQSRSHPADSPENRRFVAQAQDAFQRIAEQGKEFEEIASLYLRTIEGSSTDPARMTDADLRRAARGAMGEQKFDLAAGFLEKLKSPPSPQDSFDLAVCLAQSGQTRRAADGFSVIVDSPKSGELAERAAEYAYRCRRDLAAQTKSKQDYTALARSAELLTGRYPRNPLAGEARWVAALAHQEAGELEPAIKAYGMVDSGSEHYWSARKNQARCLLIRFDGLPDSTSPTDRLKAARSTADSLIAFAKDIEAAKRNEGGYSSRQARLDAASILVRDDIRLFSEALAALQPLKADSAVLGLRIKCQLASGDLSGARKSLLELLKAGDDKGVSSAVHLIIADTITEVLRLRKAGKMADAKKTAVAGIATLEDAMRWASAKPDRHDIARDLRQSLAELMHQSGRLEEASEQLEKLMADEPANGRTLLLAARIEEERSESAKGSDKPKLADRAESLWVRLLEDGKLRETAPAVYWEARYRWLGHQLRRGRSSEVARAIDTERAWYPELGGPPWQGQLLDLADKARSATPGS